MQFYFFFYYFDITNNAFCPDLETSEYPTCIANYIGVQNIEECSDDLFNSFNNNDSYLKKNIINNKKIILNRPLK